MMLKNVAAFLVLTCIAQLVLLAHCDKGLARKGKGKGDGKGKGGGNRGGTFKGKFSTKDKTCGWSADGQDVVTLGVSCNKGGLRFGCQYTARPSVCPQYASNSKVYWKQISKALKNHKNLCQDASGLVKSGMCKTADKDAHFRLSLDMNAPPAEKPKTSTQGGKKCKDGVDHRKRAEENCSSTLSSLCTFFFSVFQSESEDC